MAYSNQRIVSDGTLKVLMLTIEFFDKSEISVLVNDVPYPFTWATSTSIEFATALPSGATVVVRRNTDISEMRHVFTAGAQFTNKTLDEDYKQILHIAQESVEGSYTRELFNDLDMHAYRVRNMGDAVLPRDAVPLEQVQAIVDANASLLRAVRVSLAEAPLAPLPPPASRAGQLLGFDTTGQIVTVAPASGSAAELAMKLADDVDPLSGAAMVGRGVVVVGSLEDLQVARRKSSMRYWVQNYYRGGKGGGNYWRWDSGSNATPNYGTVIQVAGVPVGRWVVVKDAMEFTTEEFGVRPENTGVDNRLRIDDMFKHAANKAITVKLPTVDCIVDASTPIIFGADSTVIGRGGKLIPVLELPLNPATIAANPDGTFKVYGGMFGGGDVLTRNRYSETYFPRRGICTFINVEIANERKVTAGNGYSLHGIISHGGIIQHFNNIITDMPNTGIVSTMYREAHYSRVKCIGNGMLGGGGARNGISNTSTYSIRNATFPEADRTKMLTVLNGIFTDNFEEGIQYANCPFVYIAGNDCRRNLDRGIEGDSAYPQTVKTRPNDKLYLIDNDCRGVPGVSNYSITSSDGYNKDIVMSGNTLGGCKRSPLVLSCSSEGSVVFSGKNVFELTDIGLEQGCHAMYINAGIIDLSAGVTIRGSHDRSPFNAVILSANNDLSSGSLTLANVTSDVVFSQVLAAKSSSRVRVGNINCTTARSPVQLTLTGNMKVLELADFDGQYNTSAASDQGILRLIGLDAYEVEKIVLKGNLGDGSTSNYPISVGATAVAGRVKLLISTGNYWAGFKMPTGARLTSLVGLAAKTAAADIPAAV